MRNLERNDTNELIYKTETDSDLENEFMVTTRGYEWREGQLGSLVLTCIHCYI